MQPSHAGRIDRSPSKLHRNVVLVSRSVHGTEDIGVCFLGDLVITRVCARLNGSLWYKVLGVSDLQAKEREAWSAKRETKIRGLEDYRTYSGTFNLFENSLAYVHLLYRRCTVFC